jgi:hypothetical protein
VIPLLSALAVLAAAALGAVLHGFARHGWGPRLASWLYGDLTPDPTPHHARHTARLSRLRRHHDTH